MIRYNQKETREHHQKEREDKVMTKRFEVWRYGNDMDGTFEEVFATREDAEKYVDEMEITLAPDEMLAIGEYED